MPKPLTLDIHELPMGSSRSFIFSTLCTIAGEAMLMGAGGNLFSGSPCIVCWCLFACHLFLLPLNLGRKIVGSVMDSWDFNGLASSASCTTTLLDCGEADFGALNYATPRDCRGRDARRTSIHV